MTKQATIIIVSTVFLFSATGCSDHWFVWGNPKSQRGQASLFPYEAQPGGGLLKLGLQCMGEYPDDPRVVVELTGTRSFADNVEVVLTWDDQESFKQQWAVEHRFTTTTGRRNTEFYWVYPPNTRARRQVLLSLASSEYLTLELVGSFSDYVDVHQGRFKTKGANRVLEELASYCGGKD